MSSSDYTGQLSDSSLELPQCPSPTSTACPMPKKSKKRKQRNEIRISKDVAFLQGPQCLDDIPGLINLDFEMNSGIYAYSKMLKKIYVSTNQTLSVKFNWISTFEPLFLRSAIIYAEECHRATPVQRCYAHMGPELPQNSGLRYDQLRHVFRTLDPTHLTEPIYETDINGIFTTKSTLKANSAEAWINYQFFCQNSCSTGINRRPIKMIFLIEDSMGVVLGKRSSMIQICSNPKRDMERDENRMLLNLKKSKMKKQAPLPPLPPIDSPDSCNVDETVYTLDIDILGEENYKSVLKYAYDVMASQAIRTGNHQLFKPHMDAALMRERDG